MTVGELKSILEEIPDDYQIYGVGSKDNGYLSDFTCSYSNQKEEVLLNLERPSSHLNIRD